jgi:porin
MMTNPETMRRACALVCAVGMGSAFAQAPNPARAGAVDAAATTEPAREAVPQKPADSGVLAALAERGIYTRLLLNMELAANPSGGIEQGATASQYVVGGVDVDLQKMMGWTGAKVQASVIGIKSRSLTTFYIGGGTSAQENSAPFTLLRFLDLSFHQNFSLYNKNDLGFSIGRMSAFQTFAKSPYSTLFQNHAHSGALYGFSQSSGTVLAPLSTWGGRVSFRPSEKTYVHAGSFSIDPATLDAGTHLWDFSSDRITGQNYMLETGYETDFTNDAMPRRIRLGAWYLDAARNDVYLNTQGRSFTTYGGMRETHRHGNGLYVMGDQVISRPDLKSRRNVAVFGSMVYNRSDAEAIKYTAKVGLVKTGTFAGRNNDTVGIVASTLKMSDKQVSFLSERRALGGGTGRVNSEGYVVEAAYSYALAPGITVAPNIQYLHKPDSRVTPNYARDINDALVIGVRMNANIGALFNFPRIAF